MKCKLLKSAAFIRIANYWPAAAMKVEKDYGTISEGKYADIIAVRNNVLRYIVLLQRVDLVIEHGVRHNNSFWQWVLFKPSAYQI